MKFSKRTNWNPDANPLSSALEEIKKQGAPVIDLTVSNPTKCGFQYLSADLLDAFKNPENLNYDPNPHGLESCREKIRQYYAAKKIQIGLDQIFITANTSEAYSFLFRLLLEPGDKIAVPAPSYPLISYLGGLNDAELYRYPLHYSQGRWHSDFERIFEKIFLAVHPNNPTGNYLTVQEMKSLYAQAAGKNTAVVADEVFFDFNLDDKNTPLSFASQNEALTFTLSGASKIFGLPQMKISWIIVTGPEKEKREAIHRLEIISDTYLSASTPSQNAVAAWFEKQPEIRAEILVRLRRNWDFLYQTPNPPNAIQILNTEGGWYAVLKFPESKDDEAWCLDLLKNCGVLVHPGYLFDFEEGPFGVLSLLAPEAVFQEGVKKVFGFLK